MVIAPKTTPCRTSETGRRVPKSTPVTSTTAGTAAHSGSRGRRIASTSVTTPPTNPTAYGMASRFPASPAGGTVVSSRIQPETSPSTRPVNTPGVGTTPAIVSLRIAIGPASATNTSTVTAVAGSSSTRNFASRYPTAAPTRTAGTPT